MSDLSYTGPLWIPGHPVSKGSMKCVAQHVKGQHARLVPDKRADPDNWHGRAPGRIALSADALRDDPINAPVEMTVDFYLERPAKPDYPDAPISQHSGDLDKLTRGIGDAVQGSGILYDDSRICRIIAEKLYVPPGKQEGAWVEIKPYTPPPTTPNGGMPVRLQVGRTNALVGSLTAIEGLPNLLRQVADEMEKRGHERAV